VSSTKAIAYYRTSSAANVGADKDSLQRQKAAVLAYAKAHRISVVAEFYDAAVSGADPIEARPGFGELLDRIEGNGLRVVLVEDASRFARDLITQELGVLVLIKRGVRVLTANGDDLTDDSDPARKMMRQVAGAFAEYEKARIVAKLRAARVRKRKETGRKVEGRKSYRETQAALVAEVRDLRRRGQTLQQIASALAQRGHLNSKGHPFAPTQIARMVASRG
jgi:DNA invertase Pin-like site-specific DNA recombinase